VELMTIYATPGGTFDADIEGVSTGQAGVSIGLTVKDANGATVVARTTAGIVEIAPTIYVKHDMPAPAIGGDQYYAVWDYLVAGVTKYSNEELIVGTGPSLPDNPGLATNALTNVAAFAAWLDEEIEVGDPTAFAIRIINGYSTAIHRYTEREFLPVTPALNSDQPVARRFRYDGSGILSLTDPISDLRSLGGTGYGGIGGITMFSDRPTAYQYQTVAGTTTVEGEYRLEPRSKTEEGTYLWLELPTIERSRPRTALISTSDDAQVFSAPSRLNDEVTITGYWGIGYVPADVEQALLICCEVEWRKQAARARGQVPPIEAETGLPSDDRAGFWLPYEARSLLNQFMRPRPRRLLV
jgi:hypothetical protein